MHLALGAACLLLSKPNTAWPALVVCLVALQRGGVRRRVIAMVAAGAAVLASLALACAHVTPWGMLAAYVGLAGRLVPRAFVNGILYGLYARYGLANLLVYATLGPALFCALAHAWEKRRAIAEDSVLVLGFGSVAVALVGMGTNFDFKLTDAPLLLLGLALLTTAGERPGALWARTATATAALLMLSLYFGVTRFRMQILGTWADDKCPARVSFDDPFLGSFRACAVVPQTLAEVDRTLLGAEGERVFFGPSLEFLYPAWRIPAPAHLPDWWHGSRITSTCSSSLARRTVRSYPQQFRPPSSRSTSRCPGRSGSTCTVAGEGASGRAAKRKSGHGRRARHGRVLDAPFSSDL